MIMQEVSCTSQACSKSWGPRNWQWNWTLWHSGCKIRGVKGILAIWHIFLVRLNALSTFCSPKLYSGADTHASNIILGRMGPTCYLRIPIKKQICGSELLPKIHAIGSQSCQIMNRILAHCLESEHRSPCRVYVGGSDRQWDQSTGESAGLLCGECDQFGKQF